MNKPFISPVAALEKRPDLISDARFCCQSWVSANFCRHGVPLQKEKKEAIRKLFEVRFVILPE